ncbi:MAG: hypothetical protein QXG12_08410, partial [Thermoproteota archaeon]
NPNPQPPYGYGPQPWRNPILALNVLPTQVSTTNPHRGRAHPTVTQLTSIPTNLHETRNSCARWYCGSRVEEGERYTLFFDNTHYSFHHPTVTKR